MTNTAKTFRREIEVGYQIDTRVGWWEPDKPATDTEQATMKYMVKLLDDPKLLAAARAKKVRLLFLSYSDVFIEDYEDLMACLVACAKVGTEESKRHFSAARIAFNRTWQVKTHLIEMQDLTTGARGVTGDIKIDDALYPAEPVLANEKTIPPLWGYIVGDQDRYAIIDLETPGETLVAQVKKLQKKRGRGKKVYGQCDDETIALAEMQPKTGDDFNAFIVKTRPYFAEKCGRVKNGKYCNPPRVKGNTNGVMWSDTKRNMKRQFDKHRKLAEPIHGQVFSEYPIEPPAPGKSVKSKAPTKPVTKKSRKCKSPTNPAPKKRGK